MRWQPLISIPVVLLAWCASLALSPLWLVVAALIDLSRRRRAATLRTCAFILFYLTCELTGLTISLAFWLRARTTGMDAERWQALHYWLEGWWGGVLFRGIVRLYGLRLEVDEPPDLGRGPYLFLLRHTSIGEVLVAAALVSRPHGMRLRYVFKKELLFAPCLNVVGHRVPNVFVDRDAEDSSAEVARIRALGEGLGPRDGVLIYPEGTRFSEAKREGVLASLARADDPERLAYARSLRFVLPPKPRGVLALLEAAPEADVVVCAHVGLEGSQSLARLLSGELIGRRIHIAFRRTPREAIPTGRQARELWLRDEWRWLDGWVGACAGAAATGGTHGEATPRAAERPDTS